MATIFDAKLAISHDHRRKTATPVVTCKIRFTPFEMCLMKSCEGERMFKLKCQLWGADSGLTGADDFLYTYPKVLYYPDATPSSPESAEFKDTVGEGLLDEDWGTDEIYGKLILTNLFTLVQMTKKTNQVSHSF